MYGFPDNLLLLIPLSFFRLLKRKNIRNHNVSALLGKTKASSLSYPAADFSHMAGLPKTAWANAVFNRMADYIRNIYHRAIWEQSNSFVSVLIPLWGLKTIDQTVLSVSRQRGVVCEVLILRNGIQTLPQGTEEEERDYVYPGTKYMVREVFIRKQGKGEALNTGIRLARSNLISVLDADCILDDNALSIASMHFVDKRVVAVGGRLVVTPEGGSFLETVQDCEYMKTFQLTRRLFALLNAQCLVSGAFGVFRKGYSRKSLSF